MKYRNISGEARLVAHLNRMVEPDEVVTDILDNTFRVWPDTLWEAIGKVPPMPDDLEPYPDPDYDPAAVITEPVVTEPAPTVKREKQEV